MDASAAPGYLVDMSLTITDHPPGGLPPVAEVAGTIREMDEAGESREAIDAALTAKWPEVDALTGVPGAAEWLGLTPKSIYQERSRKRADGTPRFPASVPGVRGLLWTWRTLAWHVAEMPEGPRKDSRQS
jgi:lambda repressor-like predicted transcriptional regulator